MTNSVVVGAGGRTRRGSLLMRCHSRLFSAAVVALMLFGRTSMITRPNITSAECAGNVSDVLEANSLLHGEETDAFGDAGYQGVHKRPDARAGVNWHVAMKPGRRRLLPLRLA